MLWIEETIESQSLPLTPKEVQQYIDRGEVVPAGKMDLAHDWLADLAKKLLSFVNLSSGDGNIARARVLSLIVTLWTCRVIRAKCHNTHYPKKDRKKSLVGNYQSYLAALQECIIDDSQDHLYFPHVGDWDSPFLPTKKPSRRL